MFLVQEIATPSVEVTDPGIGSILVLVDTAAGSWVSSSSVILPTTPRAGALVIVKDSTGEAAAKPISVSGAIDGEVSDPIAASYATRSYFYSGSEWKVV